MKLIDILVQELPKRGGWPEGANESVQDKDGTVKFFDSQDLYYCHREESWSGTARGNYYCTRTSKIIKNNPDEYHETTIVTREQYEAALAASKVPVWNGEGLPPVGVSCEWYDQNVK